MTTGSAALRFGGFMKQFVKDAAFYRRPLRGLGMGVCDSGVKTSTQEASSRQQKATPHIQTLTLASPRRTGTRSMSLSTTPLGSAPDTPEAWQATRAQTALATQVMRDSDDERDPQSREIGRQVGPDERELFVSCAPAEALQQQIDHLHPDYIAVHDVGTTSSRRLLAGIAAASKR